MQQQAAHSPSPPSSPGSIEGYKLASKVRFIDDNIKPRTEAGGPIQEGELVKLMRKQAPSGQIGHKHAELPPPHLSK